jgi:hypothetical protein
VRETERYKKIAKNREGRMLEEYVEKMRERREKRKEKRMREMYEERGKKRRCLTQRKRPCRADRLLQ